MFSQLDGLLMIPRAVFVVFWPYRVVQAVGGGGWHRLRQRPHQWYGVRAGRRIVVSISMHFLHQRLRLLQKPTNS